jgi:hypothetical protein
MKALPTCAVPTNQGVSAKRMASSTTAREPARTEPPPRTLGEKGAPKARNPGWQEVDDNFLPVESAWCRCRRRGEIHEVDFIPTGNRQDGAADC